MITAPQETNFSNTVLRPYANAAVAHYWRCKELVQQWADQGHAAGMPDSGGEVISDGATADGRPIMAGSDANQLLRRAQEYVASMESADSVAGGSHVKLESLTKCANQWS